MRRRSTPSDLERLLVLTIAVVTLAGVGLFGLLRPVQAPSPVYAALFDEVWQFLRPINQVALAVALLSGPLLIYAWRRTLRGRQLKLRAVDTRGELAMLTPLEFEVWCTHQLTGLGYRVRHTGRQGDHGIDIIAERDGEVVVVQCKRNAGRRAVGEPELRDLFGAMLDHGAARAIAISAGWFSAAAKEWARGKPIELWDVEHLTGLRPAASTVGSAEPPAPMTLACANCGSEVVLRRNRRDGSSFYGCSRYPACHYTRPAS